MNNRFLYLSDLDHSLFQSLKSDDRGNTPMTVNQDGEPHGFAREDQKDLFEMMKRTGVIVPVTARSHQQMERVSGWQTGQDYDLAITDIGATLLMRDNQGDGQWHAIDKWHEQYLDEISLRTPTLIRDYQMAKDTLLPEAGLSDSVQVDLIALGKRRLPLYFAFAVKGDNAGDKVEYILERFAKPIAKLSGIYHLHVTESLICLWPDFISKGQAVERFKEVLKTGLDDERLDRALTYLDLSDRTIITVGDNVTDVEFMKHGHFAMAPKNSDIITHMSDVATKLMTNC